jgi:hypothetical protein
MVDSSLVSGRDPGLHRDYVLTYEEIADLADVIIAAGHDEGSDAPFELARAILKAGYRKEAAR